MRRVGTRRDRLVRFGAAQLNVVHSGDGYVVDVQNLAVQQVQLGVEDQSGGNGRRLGS